MKETNTFENHEQLYTNPRIGGTYKVLSAVGGVTNLVNIDMVRLETALAAVKMVVHGSEFAAEFVPWECPHTNYIANVVDGRPVYKCKDCGLDGKISWAK